MTRWSRHAAAVLVVAAPTVLTINIARQTQPPPRGFVEEIRIVSDERNPATTLTMPNDLIVNAKGWIFTAHADEGIIRVFDGNGRFLRTLGRKGKGPGEFQRSFSFHSTVGDTLIVYDIGSWALVWFLDNGRYLRTVPIARSGNPPKNLLAVSYLGRDRMFGYMTYFSPRGSDNQSDSTVYWLATSSGEPVRRILAQGAVQSFSIDGGITPTLLTRGHLYPRTFTAGDTYGLGFIIRPHTSFGGTPDQVQIMRIGRDGIESQRIVTLPGGSMSASEREYLIDLLTHAFERTSSMTARLMRAGAPAMPRADVEREVRAELTRLGMPPVMSSAKAGVDGSLWINSLRRRLDWTVVTPTGQVAYRVRVMDSTRVMRVSQDQFWAITPDSDGLPIITRNRVAGR